MNKFSKGEIVSNLGHKYQSCLIKFKINNNQIKIYDKENNSKIEVTINNPKDFKILKEKVKITEHRTIEKEKVWVTMDKSISNLYRYVEINKSIIKIYIEALPNINTDEVPISEINNILSCITINNRKYTRFNILEKDTLTLFSVISSGEYLINVFFKQIN